MRVLLLYTGVLLSSLHSEYFLEANIFSSLVHYRAPACLQHSGFTAVQQYVQQYMRRAPPALACVRYSC